MVGPPLVRIGLPVYNGEPFIRETLESLLAQDFRDFELLISDNASTDGTEAICRAFAARDPRVVYHRHPKNRGAMANFNGLFERAAGTYFIWASAHDQWHPKFLSTCVRVMESDPSVVLCYAATACIDEQGRLFATLPGLVDTRGMDLRARFHAVTWRLNCAAIYGLHRAGALAQVIPMLQAMGGDNILLSELAFLGPFAAVPERMFYYRMTDNVGDLPSYFRRLNLHLTPWRAAALYGAYARAYLAMAWRRSRAGSERVCLVASTLLRLAKGACGFFGSLAFLACFPRTYARVMRWLVRRHGGQEWHERKGSDGAAVQ